MSDVSEGFPPSAKGRPLAHKTLLKMTELKPWALAELRRVPGVGEVKLARYGEAFLEALN